MSSLSKKLDTTDLKKEMWLIKVPMSVAEKWEKAPPGTEVMTLKEIEKKDGGTEKALYLNTKILDGALGGGNECKLTNMDHIGSGIALLAESGENVNQNSAAFTGEHLAMKGTVHKKLMCRPVFDEAYFNYKKQQFISASLPKRVTKVIENPLPLSTHRKKSHKHRNRDKKYRADKYEAMEEIFSAFEKQQYYSLKSLAKVTKQPPNYLKELLTEVGVCNKEYPNKNLWELKDEFKHPAEIGEDFEQVQRHQRHQHRQLQHKHEQELEDDDDFSSD